MSELYHNFRDIKQFGEREKEIQKLLSTPGVEERINAIAATFSDIFGVTTKLFADLRPGAEFLDVHTKITYIYEATYAPFDIGALNELILIAAKDRYEELKDQGYVTFRQKGLNGSRHIMSLRDMIKMVAMKRFEILDFMISDEREATKNIIL